ncbi:AAA family ATPase [Cytobacillus firmus]|uniref:Nuclease SbcCD subunit C n=1 Tax=Cytobacillus firmus DS1 TaxID=1307436 RepID=W7KYQ2_CYTFI|nr:AAA family ATPase [Cytobacillus firmus]EWG08466.1 SMC domain-containing protein [Cytobacillus firmus DS1]
MLLEEIRLKNFRQYYNEQIIKFSKSASRNVTVIHGENGSGKTALLNAFSWCFYGKLDLPNSNLLINEQSLKDAHPNDEVECSVSVKFSDNEKKYILKRRIIARKEQQDKIFYGEPEVQLEYKIGGNSEIIMNPTDEINRILPENLRSYFFFDGERIDNLSKDNGSDEIKNAIKNIMGLEILERSIKHTGDASTRFRSELKNYGDSKTVHLIEEIEQLESQLKEFNTRRELLVKNLDVTKKQMKEIENKLKFIEGSQKLQQEKEQKDYELENIKTELKKINKELQEVVSKNGYLAFSYTSVNNSEVIVKDSESDGFGIPGIRSASLIDDLIQKGKCICGTEIKENSEHYLHLLKVKEYLPPQSLDSAIINFKTGLNIVKDNRKKFYEQLKELKQKEVKLQSAERKIREEINEIKSKLNEKDSEEISSLVTKLEKLEDSYSAINREIGGIDNEIRKLTDELNQKEKEQKKINSIAEKAQLAQRRIEACQTLVQTMEDIYKIREKLVRVQLQERITEVYRQFLRKGFDIRLSEQYELNVYNQNNNKVGMSQGERQITSLAFIGAIVDLAREQYKKEIKGAFEEGGIYPLVMDSPFGALDSDHRERIAKGIHKLSDQVIVIVSTSQWRGEVEGQMKELIGKEYQLNYNDPRLNKEQPYEYTEAVEVM